ncbi:MAG: hypothetical protein LAN64_00735 [Acidobacteriia bacterium]|nr:hypothetical protein [Terriglobia bacterium]
MLDIVVLVGGLALLAFPGVGLWPFLFQQQTPVERYTWGATAGLALAVLVTFYLAYLRLSWFWPVWFVFCAACVVPAWRSTSAKPTRREGSGLWLGLLLAVVAISRFAPVFFRETPPGWDPSFHLILIRKLVLADHMVSDWTPFESVPLNYPLGSHLLVAVLARLTGLPLPRVFQFLIPAFGVVSTAQVYALAARVFQRSEVGLYAAVAYGTWAFAGSIGYYTWGGLPNQLGMMFLLAVIGILAEPGWNWRTTALTALLVSAILLTHHHVSLVTAAVLIASMVYLVAARADDSRAKCRGLLLAGFVGAAAASPYLVPHTMRAAEIRNTDVLRFTEPHSLLLMIVEMGTVLVACGVAGVIACRGADRKRAGLVLTAASVLVVLYVAGAPLYRAYSLRRWGSEYVAFTPSRFLTDLVYFLSIFAGYALFRVAEHYRLRTGVVIAAGLLVALTNVPFWVEMFAREPNPERRQAYAWIEQHTPADTIVVVADAWAPYATWRRTPDTPLPVSEPKVIRNPARDAAAALANGRNPEAAFVVKVIAPGGVAPPGPRLWKSPSGWSVVQVWPRAPIHAAAR